MTLSSTEVSAAENKPLVKRIRSDRNALARAITVVENNLEGTRVILNAIRNSLGHAHVVGFTGPPGVGKSTLIDACIFEIRKLGKSAAVLAVDPSSHVSGGAILGDRVRMAEHSNDDKVFIRSVATRGQLGGLSATTLNIVQLFDAAKWDVIIVETVGTGQSEIEISRLADTTVVVEAPGLGDEVQAIKAGMLEIADIVVVNKSDLPQSDLTVSELTHAISLRNTLKAPVVLKATALDGLGVAELVAEIDRHGSEISRHDRVETVLNRSRKIVAKVLGESVEAQLVNLGLAQIDDVLSRVQSGELDPDLLAEKIVRQLASESNESDKTGE